jgi:hypothetical protein
MANRNRENAVPAGEDLPLPHVDNSSNELAGQIEGLYDFVWSVGLLCVLIAIRDWMTPDILYFITDLKEEQVHFAFIMLLWLASKCFLIAPG